MQDKSIFFENVFLIIMNTFIEIGRKLKSDDTFFSEIADKILNFTNLTINDKICRICEVEFYLYQDSEFPDKYTHCDVLQLEWGKLYFHRLNGKGYKSGTYKCMDIAIGDKDSTRYLGVLIRSMYSITDDKFISGPCLCVNYLLQQFGCNDVNELSNKVTFPIHLTQFDSQVKLIDQVHDYEKIYYAPRVGLSDKYPEYRTRLYRFAIKIKQIKREKTKFKELKITLQS